MTTTTSKGPPRPPLPRPVPPPPASRWGAGRVVAAVAAVLLAAAGLGLTAGGTAVTVVDRGLRTDGWVQAVQDEVSTDGYGVVLGDLVLDAGTGADVPAGLLGDLRVRVSPGAGRGALFTGIARTSDVEDYLGRGSTMREMMRGSDRDRDDQGTVRPMPWLLGERQPATVPAEAGIWVASVQGTGTQELTWTPVAGDWSLVVMRADARRGVSADVAVAATVPWLEDAGPWTIAGGVLLLLAAAGCAVVVARGGRRAGAR